jgi:poly-gamma-glutamate capsule biosynthesis protein CapA/YwtB (metallophosphatase superfamily)
LACWQGIRLNALLLTASDRARDWVAPVHLQPQADAGVARRTARRVQKLIRFDRDEVMAWAGRWLKDAKDQGIDAKAEPAGQYRSLQQAPASLPA